LSQTPIQTEDIVSLVDSQRFILIGRKNNVINSGGKKLSPESLEQELGDIHMPFFFAAQPDSELGEKLILLVASETETPATIRKKLSTLLESESFRFLKEIYTVPSFVYTPTGKIDRPSTLKLL
jgi:O-succinylbenzoic acid--CoA ligase